MICQRVKMVFIAHTAEIILGTPTNREINTIRSIELPTYVHLGLWQFLNYIHMY